MELEIESEHVAELAEVMEEVWPKWEKLGCVLGMTTSMISTIKQEVDKQDTTLRFLKMLERCQQDRLTKERLVRALEGKIVKASNKLIRNIKNWNLSSSTDNDETESTDLGRIHMNHDKTTSRRAKSFAVSWPQSPDHVIDMPTQVNTQRRSWWRTLKSFKPTRRQWHFGVTGCGIILIVSCIWLFSSPEKERIVEPLPAPIPSQLIGRQTELAQFAKLLKENSFCTLFGPPGVGKSALAIATGHKLQESKLLSTHIIPVYINLKLLNRIVEVEKYIFSKFNDPKKPDIRDLVNDLTEETLFIFDNSDTLAQTHFQDLCELFAKLKSGKVKILVTHQRFIPWPDLTTCRYKLEYLSRRSTIHLVEEKLQPLIMTTLQKNDVEYVTGLVDGMPLALENIKEHVTKSGTTLDTILSRLRTSNPIDVLSSDELQYSTNTVKSSISLTYKRLNRDNMRCAKHLAGYGTKTFYKSKAETNMKAQLPDLNFEACIQALTTAELLLTAKSTIKEVQEPTCSINGTILQVECKIQQKVQQAYYFHTLIMKYIRSVPDETEQTGKPQKRIVADDSENTDDSDENTWSHLVQTATNRKYCPDFYMFATCALSWGDIRDEVTVGMKNLYLPFQKRVQIGLMTTYWRRVAFQQPFKEYAKFINLTLDMFVQASKEDKGNVNNAELLAAFVFYNHESLEINWIHTESETEQCYCPNPSDAHRKMVSRKRFIENLYADPTCLESHIAWSARRSFYLDLYCCCQALRECEDQWQYWMKGLLSQISIAKMYFSYSMKDKCLQRNIPEKVPEAIEGLWYYFYTQQIEKAKDSLKKYLTLHDDCPLLKIGVVMILHEIYQEESNEADGHRIIEQYLKNGTNLIDRNVNDYHNLYDQVVLPFLHAIGKRSVAKEMEAALNKADPQEHTREVSFECKFLYHQHKIKYQDFLCLTL